ncbi:hypothetical protein ACW9HJ_35100 [Nocardia gipuzkoensis]
MHRILLRCNNIHNNAGSARLRVNAEAEGGTVRAAELIEDALPNRSSAT